MEIPLLKDILIIFTLAIAVLLVCHRLRVPSIVGFLLTGLLAGPHGLGLVTAVENVELLAQIGVILLLFTIGIEFSLPDLLEMKKAVLVGGSLQVGLTILPVLAVALALGQMPSQATFLSFLVPISSTAIILKILQEKNEIGSPHGRVALAVSIFQDVVSIPMMLLIPMLAGWSGVAGKSLLLLLTEVVGVLMFVVVSTKWIVPKVLYQVARVRSRELFLLSVLVLCFAVAWFTQFMGLSVALGAFLAGLIISASDYGYHALGSILPFRDAFSSFFFVSIGMLLDVGFLIHEPFRVALFAGGTILMKSVLAGSAVVFLGYPLRTAIITGLTLGQIGEFSFILGDMGARYGLFAGHTYQLFLAVSVVTMGAAPFVIGMAPKIADAVGRLRLPDTLKDGFAFAGNKEVLSLRGHLIIVGFGLNGRNVAHAAKRAGIPYVILEMNPETVRKEKSGGEPISYGDAAHEAVLQQAGIEQARVMVVAISDPAATRRITATARTLNPTLHIIARTRFFPEIEPLRELGANDVIPEEFETSVEIFTRVLDKYFLPRDEIDRLVLEARAGGYEMFRSLSHEAVPLCNLELHLPDMEVTTRRVRPTSPLAGKSLAEVELRTRYGITLLAIRRGGEVLANPSGEMGILAGDILIVMGAPASLAGVANLF